MAGNIKSAINSSSFELSFSLPEKIKTVVPMGVADFNKKEENAFFTFHYTLPAATLTSLRFEIIDANGQVFYHIIGEAPQLLPGLHQINWDGFDNNEIYDSRRFNDQKLQAKLTVIAANKTKSITLTFLAQCKEVQWVDIIIDRKKKKIEATLRTHFLDWNSKTIGDWKKIPYPVLSSIGKLPVKMRTRRFEELLELAKEGLKYHWGRNEQHPEGKNVLFNNGEVYSFFLTVDNTPVNSLKSPKIAYQTNARSRRSRNWELSRILFYNIGYLKHGGKWYYKSTAQADSDFKQIAAHEIGHEILLAYGGQFYSKAHKGSSTLLTQTALGNYRYPKYGEIDLMLYYTTDQEHPYPADYNYKSVASNGDVLSLLWLSKVQIKDFT